MADNYLEKKYEEWKNGKPAIRRTSPSLESLIKKCGESGGQDPSYTVKQAQLDAIVRAAEGLGYGSVFTSDESRATIRIEQPDPVKLGESALAVRLKAAELRLHATLSDAGDKSLEFQISKVL